MISDTLFTRCHVEQADAKDWLAGLPADSVDLIFTSPPYAEQRKDVYASIAADDYADWWWEIAAAAVKPLKQEGSFVINIKEHVQDVVRHPYVLELIQDMREQGWCWIDELIWHKSNALPFTQHNRLRDGYERVLHFAPQTRIKFRPDNIRVPASPNTIKRVQNLTEKDKTRRPSASGSGINIGGLSDAVIETGVVPSNVIECGAVGHNVGHPAAMPPRLAEFFIKLLTDEGDVVADPFAGSGTTLKAAMRLGRNAIGCDIDTSYMGYTGDSDASSSVSPIETAADYPI